MAPLLIAYLVFVEFLTFGPLVIFVPLLIRTRLEALRSYGILVQQHNQLFHNKWIGGPANELPLGNADMSSLVDLGDVKKLLTVSEIGDGSRRRPAFSCNMSPCRSRVVRISLLSAPNDPPVDNGALQSRFGKFRQFLRISAIPVSTPMFYRGVETEGEAEGYAGEFIVPLPQTLRPPLSTIVSAWLEQRPGRTVQLRIGESCAVAQSTEQAESFLRQSGQLRSTPWAPSIGK